MKKITKRKSIIISVILVLVIAIGIFIILRLDKGPFTRSEDLKLTVTCESGAKKCDNRPGLMIHLENSILTVNNTWFVCCKDTPDLINKIKEIRDNWVLKNQEVAIKTISGITIDCSIDTITNLRGVCLIGELGHFHFDNGLENQLLNKLESAFKSCCAY
jgi:hypothetical protein